MSRILLLEDDEALGRGICMALETPNCTVTHCSTRLQAIKILQGVVFDLLILDINLPDGSGLELLRTLRQNGTSTPAILLTANDLELDEVTGLEAGADDYITKPFSLAVLRARVNAQLRRSVPVKQERIELNGFILDFTRMEFSKEGTIIDLSKTEQRLLRLLVENRGRTLPRELLLEKVWELGRNARFPLSDPGCLSNPDRYHDKSSGRRLPGCSAETGAVAGTDFGMDGAGKEKTDSV